MPEPIKNPEFYVQMLNDEGKQKAAAIAQAFDVCLNTLTDICTTGHAFTVCKAKLEEACFFAKKAMAINLGNQQL